MKILLGVFGTQMFQFQKDNNLMMYGDICRYLETNNLNNSYDGVIGNVAKGCYHATTINFRLDEIKLPLNPIYSLTCEELEMVLNNETYLEKTIFWLNNEVVETSKVLKLIDMCKKSELTFNQINFNDL